MDKPYCQGFSGMSTDGHCAKRIRTQVYVGLETVFRAGALWAARWAERSGAQLECDGHGPKTEGESPSRASLKGIGSICNCTSPMAGRPKGEPVRECGVEANCESQF